MNKILFTCRVCFVALIGLLVLSGAVTLAMGHPTVPEEATDVQSPTGWGDDSRWEVGVEYVNYYPWPTSDLWNTDDDALGLYNVLGGGGWYRNFAYSNSLAWEKDWKASWRGGTEHVYVDTVDLAYFSGHGGRGWDSYYGRYLVGPVFGHGGRDHDDPYLVPGDAYRAYGDGDLEWVAFSACQVLNDTSRPYWANAMNGLHLLLGFKTTMRDVDQGTHFGLRIRWGWTIPQAWFGATDITHPQYGAMARVLANELCHYYYDRWGSVCEDSYDWDWWYADHWVGSQPALSVDPEDLDYQMPVFHVIAAAPSEEDLDRLAAAFNFSPSTPAVLDESNFYRITEDPLDLTVDSHGLYYFINREQLWSAPTGTLTLNAPAHPLSPQDARQIADTFLVNNNLMPPDAAFYEVVSDTLSAVTIREVPTAAINAWGVTQTYTDVQEIISETVATAYQVIYSRHIVYTPTASSPVTFSVQGPGARLKVYVSNQGQVIGAMGGWRTVDNTGVLDTVSIITPAQMLHLYQQLGSQLDLAPTPYVAQAITVTRSTVGYYEQPMGVDQAMLTPVYILDVEMGSSFGDQVHTVAYVPAAPSMMNPLAAITSYTETTPLVFVGDTLNLVAADAAQPLSTLGYGDDLDFSLGQPPYTYTWRLDTTGKVIGVGRTITYQVTFGDYASLGRNYDVPLSVILEVTDGAGRTSRSARFFYFAETLTVNKIYLPLVLR